VMLGGANEQTLIAQVFDTPNLTEGAPMDEINCAICLVESRETLQLACSHCFCSPCLDGQLIARWPGARMTFGYLNCGLCREPLAHETLDDKMVPHRKLQRECEKIAVDKFCDDGLLTEFQDQLGRLPAEEEIRVRATAVMAILQCSDCKEPFCAGKVDCAEAGQVEDVSSKATMCPSCEWTSTAAEANDHRCMVHGHRYAMFKCDSCCAVATWNCFSNHYCERCHNQACDPKHYPCPGPEKCCLGMPHPPNREAKHGQDVTASFCIGCTGCLGFEASEDLQFNDKNVFGFPIQNWASFENGEAVLAAIGEDEVRARLKVRKPTLVAEQDALCAVLCADWLLPIEIEAFNTEEDLRHRLQLEREENERRHRVERERQEAEWARQEAEQEELERQRREEQERKTKADRLADEKMWVEVCAERASLPHLCDVLALKALLEESRSRDRLRKRTRREHVFAKEARLRRNRNEDLKARAHSTFCWSSARLQRQKVVRLEIQELEHEVF